MQWHDPVPSPVALVPLLDCPEYRAELARQATERSMSNPIHAEVIPGATPAWHVVITAPGQERTAARHLIDRGFGVYLPEFQRTSFARGRAHCRTLPMFPRYLFVFVWAFDRQWRRMETCPAVVRPLCIDDRPAIVPDRIIDHIQAAETALQIQGGVIQIGYLTEPKRKRPRRRRKRVEQEKPVDAALPPGITLSPYQELVTISTKSYFASVGALDDAARNSLLMKALGLAS